MTESGPEAGEEARAGIRTTPEPVVAKATTNSRSSHRAKRPRVVLEHPDIPGPEFTIRRSFRIQDGIERFLEENVDTAWESPKELYVRAANAVWHMGLLKRRPSSVTAARWIDQLTAVGEKYSFYEVKGEGYWLLEHRGNGNGT